jgi:hypothetical protein
MEFPSLQRLRVSKAGAVKKGRGKKKKNEKKKKKKPTDFTERKS